MTFPKILLGVPLLVAGIYVPAFGSTVHKPATGVIGMTHEGYSRRPPGSAQPGAQAMDLLLVAHGPTRADLGDASERSIPITDPVSARRWLDAERVNLVPVAERASRPGGPRQTARLAQAVAAYLDHGGQHADSLVVGLPDPLGVRARLVGC